MNKTVSRIVALMSASGGQLFLLALLNLVLAKFLPVADFGTTRTTTAYFTVLVIFGHFCLPASSSSYAAASKQSEQQALYVSTAISLVILISLAVMAIAELFIHFAGVWSGSLQLALSVVIACLPLVSVTLLLGTLLQGIGSYRQLTVFLLLDGFAQLTLIALGAKFWGLHGWLATRCLVYLLMLLFSLWSMRRWIRLSLAFDPQTAKQLFAFARVQFVGGILAIAMQSADIIILERMHESMEEIAVYGLAALFARSVMFLPGAIGRVYFRDIARLAAVGQGEEWKHVGQLLLLVTLFCLLIATGLYTVIPPLIRLLYKGDYWDSIALLRVMSVGVIFSGLWMALSVINIALKQPHFAAMISMVGLISAILLLVLLIPAHGATGAAWAMNGAYCVGSITGLLLLARLKQQSRVINVAPTVLNNG